MFSVEGNTITMSRGDTGTVTIHASGYTFGSSDRVLFTMRSATSKEVKIRRELTMTDNKVEVVFTNSDTDSLDPGKYEWDVRYIISPLYENNEIYDGAEVTTPNLPMTLILLPTVGQI